ncbi:MAG: hypothetical protein REI64_05840 [Pedobacter sp.]|uniref:hypothetical protein n=1 Tax=Pedobacter sp. TaxID=1411316 RepID=UPI0028081C17|nr:hypothetical protein [Pedobacter sp.]MDQ8004302.1 hypothetical protein [Pedobacter sp.]
MKNLDLNKIDFGGAKPLSREEMKKVMGGVISPETALKMCAEQLARDIEAEENDIVKQIMYDTGSEGCIKAYEEMIQPYTLPGHYS